MRNRIQLGFQGGLLLSALVAAPQAWAQTCDAERSAYRAAYEAYSNRALGPYVNDVYFTKPCTASEVEYLRGVAAAARARIPTIAAKRDEPGRNATNRAAFDMDIKHSVLTICWAQAYVDRCSGATAPAPQPAPQAARPPVATPSSAGVAPKPAAATTEAPLPENALGIKPQEAAERAANRQRIVEAKRKFHPRRHVPEAEASKCLSLQTGPGYGGFVNSCNFAIELVFCNAQPRKDSWGEAFDCDKGQMGMWQVGPLRRVSMHTKGAGRVNWFACRWGETFGKPDGISPADVEYRAQEKQLFGRCAQWGAM